MCDQLGPERDGHLARLPPFPRSAREVEGIGPEPLGDPDCLGYGLPWPEVLPFVPEGRVCFGTGAGGSLVLVDADRRLTVAYVMNQMAPYPIVTPIAATLVEPLYDIAGR